MDNTVSAGRKSTTLGGRVWACLLIFGFVGQIAWMVENVYFSTYIQKNITAAGWATSATVSASAIAAALATFFSAAWSDRVGHRRSFVCWGYILWGATTAAFALFGNGQVALPVGLAVTVFVIMDCIMSGAVTSVAGILGLWLFKDSPNLRPTKGESYLREVVFAFRPENIRANKMIYVCFFGMMFSGLAMQMWQPYMISLVEVTLGIENYIVPIAVVVLASAVLSVAAGKVMDRFGKEKFYYPVALMQVLGGIIAYLIKFVGHAMPLLCVGGTLIMAGNLMMAGLFTASARDYTPEGRAGAVQSVKMVIYIVLPMVLASILDPVIIRAVALEPTAEILAKYPSYAGSYLYPYELFLGAAVAAVFIFLPASAVRRDAKLLRAQKLKEIRE